MAELESLLASTRRAPVVVPVIGAQSGFQVRRIYCVGRNYAAHIREMGGDERERPFFFQKPTDSIVLSGNSIPYPSVTSDFQHEIELVMALGRSGSRIPIAEAASYVIGLAVGIDLTRRDLQLEAREKGRPWESGKSFDGSAAIAPIRFLSSKELPRTGRIELRVNKELKQSGDLSQMLWNCEEILCQLSMLYELHPGDLVFTGTPAGVGKLIVGDYIEGSVEHLEPIFLTIDYSA